MPRAVTVLKFPGLVGRRVGWDTSFLFWPGQKAQKRHCAPKLWHQLAKPINRQPAIPKCLADGQRRKKF